MSVVISEVEHRPPADAGADGVAGAPPPPEQAMGLDEIQAILRRESSRRARLWAD